MKRIIQGILILITTLHLTAQPLTHPAEKVQEAKGMGVALTGITLIPEPGKKLENATLLIREGKIVAIGQQIPIPAGYQVQDKRGCWVYPGLIELWQKYPTVQAADATGCWNPAVHPQTTIQLNAEDKALTTTLDQARKEGFTTVLLAPGEGIFRGRATLMHTGRQHPAQEVIRTRAATVLSFEKGKSPEDYPASLMGAMALIRQTFSDAEWYARQANPPEYNACLLSLQEDRTQKIPFLFEATTINDVDRIRRLGEEHSIPFIIRGTGREYERIPSGEINGCRLILPLQFPLPPETGTQEKENQAGLYALRHWAWAPANAALLAQNHFSFCFTTDGLKDPSAWRSQMRKAIDRGLSEEQALAALTTTPASWLGLQNQIGSLKPGASADLVILNGSLFQPESHILETWVRGQASPIAPEALRNPRLSGTFRFQSPTLSSDSFLIRPEGKNLKGEIRLAGKKSIPVTLTVQSGLWDLSLTPDSASRPLILSGIQAGDSIRGKTGSDTWFAVYTGPLPEKSTSREPDTFSLPALPYPNRAWGRYGPPESGTWHIRNVQVWTNLSDSLMQSTLRLSSDQEGGILTSGDVIISEGKIQAVGKNLATPSGARVLDGAGMHLTPGIIDEHSHIAIERGVNEGTQAITAEVRIGDALRAEDLNIFRQLAGGVTTSQLLHGSANPIGGQSAIIKLRWGMPAAALPMKEAPPFIKFALGENVKQSNWGDRHTTRFPQSRPGVEQVMEDGFQRAQVYQQEKNAGSASFRKDLELETLCEILQGKRFITCHSYVQSEITMLMRLAERFQFRINTFTHVLEGYKIADKIRAHGASASSFSDWWAYKYEVMDAIPYNGAILTRAGVNTGFNSDDAEMGRRLNQEAAKAVKYGGLKEWEALRLVTLNPAKMLRIDAYVGTIEPGKQADLVLWSDHPLSVYAVAQKTWIDGRLYFDRSQLGEIQTRQEAERTLLLERARKAGSKGNAAPAEEIHDNRYHCDTLEQHAHEEAH